MVTVRKGWEALAVLLLAVPLALAQGQTQLPHYAPQQRLESPEIMHSWGEPQMAGLMKAWEAGFEHYQPAVRFDDKLFGTETAQAALFTHVADLALMGRAILMLERHVMFRREHHLPLEVMVATGSYDVATKSPALAIFVDSRNPISSLTVAQLDGIFGDERTGAWDDKFIWHPEYGRSNQQNIRTWGQLGVTGEWADKKIDVYGYPVTIYSPTSGPMMSFRKHVLQGGDIWNPALKEFDSGAKITQALAQDKFGIAYACLCDARPEIKSIAVSATAGGPAVQLNKGTVAAGNYPLSRAVYIYIDRTPGQPLDPKVDEFLHYVLSREGQAAVAADGGYLPLTDDLVQEQLHKLE